MEGQYQQRNKRLPNRITTDQELSDWCSDNVPGFMGVIDRTQFKSRAKSMGPGNSVIINLDPKYKHGGTHWVAYRVSSEAPISYYKDSFGAPPPADVASQCNCIYGNRINQGINEQNCGRRAAEWLRDISWAARNGREIEWFERSELSGRSTQKTGAGAAHAAYEYPELATARKKAAKYGVTVESSQVPPHKLKVEWDGHVIHFGHRNYDDYNIHGDKERRARYRARARGQGRHDDPRSANFWSYHILW